jgi:hypothetical protein
VVTRAPRGGKRQVVLVPLDDLRAHPRNPKAHKTAAIGASVGRFGFVEPIVVDGRTGLMVSGHGRAETLRGLRDGGGELPEGCALGDEGAWLVPVMTGWASRDDGEALALLLALNRAGELGGWDAIALGEVLTAVSADELLPFTGFTAADVRRLGGGDDEQDTGPQLAETGWALWITCRDEAHQRDLMARLDELGAEYKAVMS